MNQILKLFCLIALAFLANSSIAQDNKASTTKHSHPEYEKSIQDMHDSVKKANETYDRAQETYKIMKEYDRTMENRERNFLTILGSLIGLFTLMGLGSFITNLFNNRNLLKAQNDAIKEANEKIERIKTETLEKQAKEIKKIAKGYEKTISEMILSKERDYFLRKNCKIIVLNHKDTPISIGFKKILGLFDKFDITTDMMDLDKFSDALSTDNISKFRNSDLVIIENQASIGQWKIDFPKPTEEEIKSSIINANELTIEDQNNRAQNQAIMINLANKICDKTAMVYYGPGFLQSIIADEEKQPLIAFAQSPSTLFSNIMNLLKFKDAIESHS